MKDQTISIEQMKAIASKLKEREYDFSYAPEVDQLIVTIRETDEKVSRLKTNSQVMIELTYLEDLNLITIAIHLDMQPDGDLIIASSSPNKDLVEYLEKVANGNNSIQINVIGNNLNNISCRHYFESPIAKAAISRELNKIK